MKTKVVPHVPRINRHRHFWFPAVVKNSGSNLSNVFDNSWEPKVSVSVFVTVSVTTTFVFMCRE